MTYKEDQIKFLEMICAYLPAEFDDRTEEIMLYEDTLKRDGFSYNQSVNLLKDMIQGINKLEDIEDSDGRRGIFIIVINSELKNYLHSLKYSEQDYFDEIGEFHTVVSMPIIKTPIMIDNKKGIYRIDNPELVYKIKIPSKRFNLILLLTKKEKLFISEIAEKVEQSESLSIKEIGKINQNFKESLNVNNDFIVHLNTGGYSLNRDNFQIQP